MKLALLICLAVAFATDAMAHRLDEYLQATRIAVATNCVDLSINLTPGVAVADQVLAALDKDRDGKISEGERADYAKQFLKDIRLKLDENILALRLVDTSFPTHFEIRSGVGVIHINATASVEPLAPGRHVLSLTNAHQPAISVYLVNALAPKDTAIQITTQTRDELQTSYHLEFGVRRAHP